MTLRIVSVRFVESKDFFPTHLTLELLISFYIFFLNYILQEGRYLVNKGKTEIF